MLMPNPKRILILAGLSVLVLVLLACQAANTPSADQTPTPTRTAKPEDRSSVNATLTPTIVYLPTDTPDEIAENCCVKHRIGLLQAPTTLNYWLYLAEDFSPWTGLVIGDEAPSLFTYPALHSSERLDFVPALAAELPPVAVQQKDLWVIPVRMLSSATWSDGEPITAHDIVFTVQTVFDLQLGGSWIDFYSSESLAKVEAKDDYSIEFYFYEKPGLGEWQFAAAMGPILPQHYWAEYVDQARENIEGLDPPVTCAGDLTLEQISVCQAYDSARQLLFDVEPESPPSGGGYVTVGGSVDTTLRRKANLNFYAADLKIVEYEDGTWERIFPDGTLQQFYGEAVGDPLVSYHRGPFSDSIEIKIYTSYRAALDDFSRGRIDTILNPSGQISDELVRASQSNLDLQYDSPQNGLAYLAFNLRHSPGSLPEFRYALESLIDRQQISEIDLEALVYPAYSIISPDNAFWWNPSLAPKSEKLSRRERLELAVQSLKGAGWTWKTEPSWNSGNRQVVPGEEARLPDGQPIPEISFIYPLPDENLLMSAFGDTIAEALLSLGIPVVVERLPREQIINRALIAGGSFDLYILDWQFPLYPDYLCELFDSQNDTLLTGGYNTSGYNSPRFDEVCASFLIEADAQRAQEQAFRLQSQLAYDRPYLPLFYPKIIDLLATTVLPPYFPQLDGFSGQNDFQTDTRVLIK